MAKKAKIEAPENKTLGISMNRLASTTAVKIEPFISTELDQLSTAREYWEGGKFAVMYAIKAHMTPEQIAELPDPKSKTGNNPAHYQIEKFRDGKSTGWKPVYFYKQLALELPGVAAMGKRIDQMVRSMQNPEKVFTGDIGQDIKDMSLDYRVGQIKKLERRIANAVSNVEGAFELHHQIALFDTLKHVDYDIVYALNEKGEPLDGKDGRGFEVEATQVPIVIYSTVEGRQDKDRLPVSVGGFLRYDIEKAKEQGGTYQALLNTVKREKPDDAPPQSGAGQQAPQRVNTPDTFFARMTDCAEFIDKAWSEKTDALQEACLNAVHGAGSDDAFTAARQTYEFLRTLVGGPKDDIRWQSYINEDKEHPLHKAA